MDIKGLTKNEALTKLISSGEYNFTEASDFWVANRPKRGTGFSAKLFGRLEEGHLSEEDFDELLADTSRNTKAHRSYFDNIRNLANTIRANVEAENAPEEEAA